MEHRHVLIIFKTIAKVPPASNAFISCCLDYCHALFFGLPKKTF